MNASKKAIRKAFRIAVFTRDNYQCLGCGYKSSTEKAEEELDAHHIVDRNEEGYCYDPQIGITLCKAQCHLKAEKWHITGGQQWEPGFHPNDLMLKIKGRL